VPDAGALSRRRRAAAAAFRRDFGRDPERIGWGPGRINIVGEHTDYSGGLAMPAAIDRWVLVALAARDDGRVHVLAPDMGGGLEFALDEPPEPERSWQRFVLGLLAVSSRSPTPACATTTR